MSDHLPQRGIEEVLIPNGAPPRSPVVTYTKLLLQNEHSPLSLAFSLVLDSPFLLLPGFVFLLSAYLVAHIDVTPAIKSGLNHFAGGVVFSAAATELLPKLLKPEAPIPYILAGLAAGLALLTRPQQLLNVPMITGGLCVSGVEREPFGRESRGTGGARWTWQRGRGAKRWEGGSTCWVCKKSSSLHKVLVRGRTEYIWFVAELMVLLLVRRFFPHGHGDEEGGDSPHSHGATASSHSHGAGGHEHTGASSSHDTEEPKTPFHALEEGEEHRHDDITPPAPRSSTSYLTAVRKLPWNTIIAIGIDIFLDGLLVGISCATGAQAGFIMAISVALEMATLGGTLYASMGGGSSRRADRRVEEVARLVMVCMAFLILLGGVVGVVAMDSLCGR